MRNSLLQKSDSVTCRVGHIYCLHVCIVKFIFGEVGKTKNTTNLGSAKITMSDICILGILPRPPILCPPWPALYPLILVEVQWTVLPWVENETPLEWRPQSLLWTNTQILVWWHNLIWKFEVQYHENCKHSYLKAGISKMPKYCWLTNST